MQKGEYEMAFGMNDNVYKRQRGIAKRTMIKRKLFGRKEHNFDWLNEQAKTRGGAW